MGFCVSDELSNLVFTFFIPILLLTQTRWLTKYTTEGLMNYN
jgi:hypothetical protein